MTRHAARCRRQPSAVTLAALAALLASGLAAGPAQAAIRTWNGGSGGNHWSADGYIFGNRITNWSGQAPPVTGDSVVFAGSNGSHGNNDLVGLGLAGMSFAANASSFKVSGNAVTLAGDILNQSSALHTLLLPIGLSAASTWDGGSGGLLVSGAVTQGRFNLALKNKVEIVNTGLEWAVGSNATTTLSLASGSRLSNGTAYIGKAVGEQGVVTLADSGSAWQSSGNLYVGSSGRGTLQVRDGAQVSNAQGYLAYFAGSSGTALVNGAGSRWDHSQDLKVGVTGSGRLDIEAGGEVLNQSGYLGYVTGGVGRVTVTGAGSRWVNSASLTVGLSGTGTVNLLPGGRVEVGTVLNIGDLGRFDLAGGTLQAGSGRRTGNGQFNWTSGGLVLDTASLGDAGGLLGSTLSLATGRTLEVGTLQLNTGTQLNMLADGVIGSGTGLAFNGGSFNLNNKSVTLRSLSGNGSIDLGVAGNNLAPGWLKVASSQDSSFAGVLTGYGQLYKVGAGTLTLTGSFSQLTQEVGEGLLRVGNGGRIQLDTLLVGGANNSTGAVTVDGGWLDARWAVVGNAGAGALNIVNGGRLTSSQADIAYSRAGEATIDSGGQWTTTSLLIGAYNSAGKVTIRPTGAVTAYFQTAVGPSGTLDLAGGSLSTALLTISQGGQFNWSSGTLRLTGSNGVNLGHDGLFDAVTVLSNGMTLDVTNTLAVDSEATLVLKGTGQVKAGQLQLANGLVRGSSLNVGNIGLLSGHGTVAAAINGGTAANTLRASGGTLTLGNANAANGFEFGGVLDVGSQRVVLLDQDQAVLGLSTLLAPGGQLEAGKGLLLRAGSSLSFVGPASVLGNFQNLGQVSGSGGALAFWGDVSGAGGFAGPVAFHAAYRPGNSPAEVDFHGGDAQFTPGSVLELEINGTTPGSQFDRLIGIANLGFEGELRLVFGAGFNPAPGSRFDLLDFAHLSGSLAPGHITVSGLDRQRLDFSRLADDGSVSVLAAAAAVPEPQTWALGLMGGLALALRMRRRGAILQAR